MLGEDHRLEENEELQGTILAFQVRAISTRTYTTLTLQEARHTSGLKLSVQDVLIL